MSKDTTNYGDGDYYYNQALSSTATYGKYSVKVTATTAASNVAIDKSSFYILPWNASEEVRDITGIGEKNDISDSSLENIIWISYLEALRDVYQHHYKERPSPNPDTGAGVDGANTTFQTYRHPIADIGGDGTVKGFGEQSCGTDISGWWIDSSGHYNKAKITVTNAYNGEITIYQADDTTPIPNNYDGLYLDYWSEYNSFDETLFYQAVNYLAANNVMLRLKEVDRVTLGDLASNMPIIEKDSNRFYKKYKSLLKKISKPLFTGV